MIFESSGALEDTKGQRGSDPNKFLLILYANSPHPPFLSLMDLLITCITCCYLTLNENIDFQAGEGDPRESWYKKRITPCEDAENRVIRMHLPLTDLPGPSCFWEVTLGLWALLILSVWKAWTQKHICKVLWVMQTKVKNMFLFPPPPPPFCSPPPEYLKGKLSKYHQWSILMGSSWKKKWLILSHKNAELPLHVLPLKKRHLLLGIVCITFVTSHRSSL